LKNFWRFKNAANTDPELVLEGDISDQDYWWDDNSVNPQQFRQDLAALGSPSNINVRINSGGGDVFAAHAIHNMLKSHPAKKTGYIDGLCASAAVIPLMACDTIKMPTNAVLMVHKPSAMLYGSYNADDMDKMSDTLVTVQDSIVAAYQAKTGRSEKDLNKLMDDVTYMNAARAKAEGFVDEVLYTDPNKVNEAFPISNKKYMIVNSVAHDMSRLNVQAIKDALNLKSVKILNGIIPPNVSTETAPEDTEWAAPTLEDFTDKAWDDLSDKEKEGIAGHYAWVAQMPPDTFGDMKLPHHRPSDGKVVWDGVKAAAARLDQADIPSADISKVKDHLGAHYKDFGKTAPWDDASESVQNKIINKGVTSLEIKTVDEMIAAYPEFCNQMVTQAVKEERTRIQEIDNIAKNLDKNIVDDAKYGEKPVNAKDLAYKAMQADNARGSDYLATRAKELAAANTNKVDGFTDSQPETAAIVDKIAAAANKGRNGGKK
jgi:ATP-dependent protease ClpP protease subunit